MKRVCIMTSVHPYNDVRIYHREAITLAKAGYHVVLLNSQFSGKDECGIRFVRVRTPHKRLGRIISSSSAFYSAAAGLDADIYHFHDPELLYTGVRLKRLGKKVIYDVHEDLPLQILDKPWLAGWQRGAVSSVAGKLEKKYSSLMDVCIGATEEISKKFPNGRTLHNYPDPGEISVGSLPFEERRHDAVYVGAITPKRGITSMLEGARLGGWSLGLAGSFETEALQYSCMKHPAWVRTSYLGRLGRKGVNTLLSNAKCGLLLLSPTPAYLRSLPIKLFEYMMAGLPVIASDIPLWRKLAGEHCALFVNPEDAGQVAAAVMWLMENPHIAKQMGDEGRRRALQSFNYEQERETLLDIYARL